MVKYYISTTEDFDYFYKIEDNLIYYFVNSRKWRISAYGSDINEFLNDKYSLPIELNRVDVLLFNLE